ncbi:hypothetical protein VPH35_028636 [Triticum aestivum]
MCKVCRSGRGSKSLDRLHSPSGLAYLSLPHPSFSNSGRRHGQADVVVRLRLPSIHQRHHLLLLPRIHHHPSTPPSPAPPSLATSTTAPPHTSRNPPDRWSEASDAPRDSPPQI